jgi:hypothetical protein
MPEAKRREEDTTVDKTMRITTTLGFFITVIVGVWFIGRWTDQIEDSSTAILAEIKAQQVVIEDVANRQSKYIGIEGLLTEQIQEQHDALMAMREFLAAKYGEVLP